MSNAAEYYQSLTPAKLLQVIQTATEPRTLVLVSQCEACPVDLLEWMVSVPHPELSASAQAELLLRSDGQTYLI